MNKKKDNKIKFAFFGAGYTARHLEKSAMFKDFEPVRFSSRVNPIAPHRNKLNDALSKALGKNVPEPSNFAAAFEALGDMLRQGAEEAEYALVSVPPVNNKDLILPMYGELIVRKMKNLKWLGYLSATSVYGEKEGGACDENTPTNPGAQRGKIRLQAENIWRDLHKNYGVPVHIFRLAGIYGEGRNNLTDIAEGKSRTIVKPGHKFNRIHVEDIVGALWASMQNPQPGEIYNLADNTPASGEDINNYAALLLNVSPPPRIEFEDVKDEISPMLRSFYEENKVILNDKVKETLGYRFKYPSYREGLQALVPEKIVMTTKNVH